MGLAAAGPPSLLSQPRQPVVEEENLEEQQIVEVDPVLEQLQEGGRANPLSLTWGRSPTCHRGPGLLLSRPQLPQQE